MILPKGATQPFEWGYEIAVWLFVAKQQSACLRIEE
ncbi:unnamed protein product, partial [Rotaria socialis]